MALVIFTLFLLIGLSSCGHQLAVYWGQDPAGGLHLKLEQNLATYCEQFQYDIIPIAFLDIFFDYINKDNLPGINLANHCNTTLKGYPGLLHCPDIAKDIKRCQQFGKKILISLGGAAGLYGFTSSSKAVAFASTIWNLFLGGESTVKPFPDVSLDGIDLDIEGGSSMYYADFLKSIRQLMDNDANKQYYITGAPQCPFPDAIMGPGSQGTVLNDAPELFDYLFVQFYNNYCYLGQVTQFNESIQQWFQFAADTKATHGKGPTIFIGLPSHPRASSGAQYYQTPDQVKDIYGAFITDPNLGGIMLWDASFDLNNVIGGSHYSTEISKFLLQDQPEIIICTIPVGGRNIPIKLKWLTIGICVFSFGLFMLVAITCVRKMRQKKLKKHNEILMHDVEFVFDDTDSDY